tara:strand:- start:560 stop:985 length:426 start_codon:yes stop_codon:yes gene_type:complete
MQIKRSFSILITILIIGAVFFSMNNFVDSNDTLIILEQIEFDAIYFENDHVVKISFNDTSNNTKSVILEVLGMDVTYHQEYTFESKSNFVEQVYLEEIPKYGWKTIPVTLEINHSEFGEIGLKTEIYEPGQSKPKIIVEQK